MKTVNSRILALSICLSPWLALQAQHEMPEPNWDRGLALKIVQQTETKTTLKPLFHKARNGENKELLAALSALQQDPVFLAPATDYLLFRFTLGLGDLDPDSVNMEILGFLSSYEAGALVAHDEHPRMGVPLFNIQAAAAGVRHGWDRQIARQDALNLMQGPADQWLSSYLSAGPAARRGFADALGFASAEQLRVLGNVALTRLDSSPELTVIAARAGLESGDFELLRQSILRGSSDQLPGILNAASRQLSTEQNIRLLEHALQQGSDTTAALAIAQLAPLHLDEPEVREMLFGTLANRNLGAAAALTLGASADPEIHDRLKSIASNQKGLAQQRASLAISTRQAGREGGR